MKLPVAVVVPPPPPFKLLGKRAFGLAEEIVNRQSVISRVDAFRYGPFSTIFDSAENFAHVNTWWL